MKEIKDGIINLLLIGVFVLTLVMVSCKSEKSETTKNIDDIEVVEISEISKKVDSTNISYTSTENKFNENEKNKEVKKRTYKMKDGSSVSYYIDAKGIVGFDDRDDFNFVNTELVKARGANSITTADRIKKMNYRVANLRNTIPAWLRTEEVMEDVSDIQKEYLELIKDPGASEKEMKENLEEFTEQFDDLKEELNETVQKFLEIRKDAIEEFNEEMKKGKIEAAIKEYNEEMKKADRLLEKESK